MSTITYADVPYYVTGTEGTPAGIIVVQEWWGLNDQIKRMAARYAEAVGALAVSPDLYRGKVATAADEASHLMSALNWPLAIEDVRNAIKYLKSKGVKKVGIVGFCMGGAMSIAAGVHVPELASGICFYGIPSASFADPKNIKIPMQFHFGEKDQSKGFSDKASALKLKEKLKESGKDVSEFYLWDADHAFMNEKAPAYPYNEAVAKQAFAKSVDFFKKTLF